MLLFGSIYGPVYCPIVAYNLLHTYPYIFNAMVGIEASLRCLFVGWDLGLSCSLFLKKNLLYRRIGFGFFI